MQGQRQAARPDGKNNMLMGTAGDSRNLRKAEEAELRRGRRRGEDREMWNNLHKLGGQPIGNMHGWQIHACWRLPGTPQTCKGRLVRPGGPGDVQLPNFDS